MPILGVLDSAAKEASDANLLQRRQHRPSCHLHRLRHHLLHHRSGDFVDEWSLMKVNSANIWIFATIFDVSGTATDIQLVVTFDTSTWPTGQQQIALPIIRIVFPIVFFVTGVVINIFNQLVIADEHRMLFPLSASSLSLSSLSQSLSHCLSLKKHINIAIWIVFHHHLCCRGSSCRFQKFLSINVLQVILISVLSHQPLCGHWKIQDTVKCCRNKLCLSF